MTIFMHLKQYSNIQDIFKKIRYIYIMHSRNRGDYRNSFSLYLDISMVAEI